MLIEKIKNNSMRKIKLKQLLYKLMYIKSSTAAQTHSTRPSAHISDIVRKSYFTVYYAIYGIIYPEA